MTAQRTAAGFERPHAVRFYKDAESLCSLVGEFLAEGFLRSEPAVVVTGAARRDGILRHLTTRGFDVASLQESGALLVVDAEQTLERFMTGGLPDAARFMETIGPVLERACGRAGPACRVYGDMVDVLWQSGRRAGAIRLEALWNSLALMRPFSLLCAYSADHEYRSGAVDEICGQHSHVVSEAGRHTPLE